MKTNSKSMIILLILVALGIWGYNFRQLFFAPTSNDPLEDSLASGEDLDVQERMAILSEIKPVSFSTPLWDPYFKRNIGPKKPPPKPKIEKRVKPKPVAKPKPPEIPPFNISYVGLLSGQEGRVFILRKEQQLLFVETGEWVDENWQFTELLGNRLIFQDKLGHTKEVER